MKDNLQVAVEVIFFTISITENPVRMVIRKSEKDHLLVRHLHFRYPDLCTALIQKNTQYFYL